MNEKTEKQASNQRQDGGGRSTGQKQAFARRRTHNTRLTLVFLAIVAVFAIVNLIVRDRDFSENENRKLAQRPAFSTSALLDGSYFSELTSYYSDQFFARDSWITLRLWEDQLLGRKESGGVYLGKDGYLLAKPETPDAAALERTAAAITDFSAAHPDVPMRMMLVPDAAAVISDKLPKNAPVRDQLADLAAVEAQLGGAVQFLPVADALRQHAGEEIYYRTDHHWTSLGAYYAFSVAAADMGITAPVNDYQIYLVSDSFQGTLSSKSGSHSSHDKIQIYVPQGTDSEYYVNYPGTQTKSASLYVSSCLEDKDQYTVFFGGNHPVVEIHTTCGSGKNLLVFKDSYANCFMQFLTPYYEHIVMIDPRYYYDDLETVFNAYGITDILFLYNADTFLKDTSLADVLTTSMETAS